jgi:hypothetical protein
MTALSAILADQTRLAGSDYPQDPNYSILFSITLEYRGESLFNNGTTVAIDSLTHLTDRRRAPPRRHLRLPMGLSDSPSPIHP